MNKAQEPNKENKKTPSQRELPVLFWAAVILAVINVGLVIWFAISPNLTSASKGSTTHKLEADGAWKPSPFTPVVDEQQPARTRVPKMRPTPVSTIDSIDDPLASDPASVSKPPIGAEVMHTVYDHAAADPAARPLNVADRSRPSIIRNAAQIYDIVDKQNDIPRVTAANFPAEDRAPARRKDSQAMPQHGTAEQSLAR